jgi:hypothetical protein
MRSRKVAVEECLVLDCYDLARHGAFQVCVGTQCNCFWRDASGRDVFRLDFWLEGDSPARYLRLEYKPNASMPAPTSCRIELESVPCRFGGSKRIFRCPGKPNGGPCGRRAQRLYLVAGIWVCRACGDLTYLACRQHDARKDALLRSPGALVDALTSPDPRKRLLGLGAYVRAAARVLR